MLLEVMQPIWRQDMGGAGVAYWRMLQLQHWVDEEEEGQDAGLHAQLRQCITAWLTAETTGQRFVDRSSMLSLAEYVRERRARVDEAVGGQDVDDMLELEEVSGSDSKS